MANLNTVESDFSQWNPSAYLREYYSEAFTPDFNELVVQFFVAQRSRLANAPELVEVGCGPTVYQLMPLAPAVQNIVVTDYLPENLAQIRLWVEKHPEAHSWETYTQLTLKYENQPLTMANIRQRETLLRGKIRDYWPCDIRLADPLGPAQRQAWSAVLSCYCADSITQDVATWRTYMHNILSLVAPGGVFLGAALAQSQHYMVDNKKFPATSLTQDDFVQLLRDLRYEDITVEYATTPEYGYEGQIFAAGRAPTRPLA